LRALPGGLTFFRVAGPVEKKPKGRSQTKKHFFCNDPLKNFASNILGLKKTFGGEILQRTAKKI
jgi:hypothetical protein